MATVNIPSYLDDPNYRYKMPKLKAKIEGRGNGIKTNIMNMGDIARSLKRPPEYPTKFCGCELGSASKFEGAEGKAIVNGAHTEADLQGLIDKFVDKFVLCPNCRLPEVDLMVSKNRVKGKCNACGFSGDMDNAHKVGTYILKNPPDGGDSTMGKKASKKSKEERQKERAMKARAKDGDSDGGDEDALSGGKEDESAEKKHRHKSSKKVDKGDKEKEKSEKKEKEKREKKEKKEKKEKEKKSSKTKSAVTTHGSDDNSSTIGSDDKSPALGGGGGASKDVLDFESEEIQQVITRLGGLFNSHGGSSSSSPTPTDYFQEVRLLQVAQDFDSVLRVYVSLSSLLDSSLDLTLFKSRLPFLQAVCDRSVSSEDILTALEEFMHRKAPSYAANYARICSELYQADMVGEEAFLARYKSNELNNESPAYIKAKEAAAPFITWLSEAESASDTSESDSE